MHTEYYTAHCTRPHYPSARSRLHCRFFYVSPFLLSPPLFLVDPRTIPQFPPFSPFAPHFFPIFQSSKFFQMFHFLFAFFVFLQKKFFAKKYFFCKIIFYFSKNIFFDFLYFAKNMSFAKRKYSFAFSSAENKNSKLLDFLIKVKGFEAF